MAARNIITEPAAVTAIASWFGSNRMLAHVVGHELEGCNWVGVPFAGSMSEIPYMTARSILVNDLHSHLMNLARVMADSVKGPELYRRLRRKIYHEQELLEAQAYCARLEQENEARPLADLDWAERYFVCSWMGRHGRAGTFNEFSGGISFRWSSSGGDSAKHYWSAVRSIVEARKWLRKCNFLCMDAIQFIGNCSDIPANGLYMDPPFPGPGELYKHKFTLDQHKQLATALDGFKQARIVIRFYDIPLIRELYPESRWVWKHLVGRKSTNEVGPEVLIMRNPRK